MPERNIQFGASIQQLLPHELVAQIGYTGSLGRNLFQRSITNLITGVNPATGAVKRQNSGFGEIDYKTSGGRDSYNALQISVTAASVRALPIGSQYSWAHSLGTSQGSNEATTVQDPFCFECERGDGPADIRHYFYLHGFTSCHSAADALDERRCCCYRARRLGVRRCPEYAYRSSRERLSRPSRCCQR